MAPAVWAPAPKTACALACDDLDLYHGSGCRCDSGSDAQFGSCHYCRPCCELLQRVVCWAICCDFCFCACCGPGSGSDCDWDYCWRSCCCCCLNEMNVTDHGSVSVTAVCIR